MPTIIDRPRDVFQDRTQSQSRVLSRMQKIAKAVSSFAQSIFSFIKSFFQSSRGHNSYIPSSEQGKVDLGQWVTRVNYIRHELARIMEIISKHKYPDAVEVDENGDSLIPNRQLVEYQEERSIQNQVAKIYNDVDRALRDFPNLGFSIEHLAPLRRLLDKILSVNSRLSFESNTIIIDGLRAIFRDPSLRNELPYLQNEFEVPLQLALAIIKNELPITYVSAEPIPVGNDLIERLSCRVELDNSDLVLSGSMTTSIDLHSDLEPSIVFSVVERNPSTIDIPFSGELNILSYIRQALVEGELKDGEFFSIENDKITSSKLSTTKRSTDELSYILKKTYGDTLTQTVFAKYINHKKGAPLTWLDIKKITVSIGAQVTINDVEDLYKAIKTPGGLKNEMLCARTLTLEQLADINQIPTFSDLSAEQIKTLLSAFKMVIKGHEKMPAIDALFDKKYLKPSALIYEPFYADLHFLRASSIGLEQNSYVDSERKAALSEYFSKELAYCEMSIGMLIPFFNESHQLTYLQVLDKTEDKCDGLICHVLGPVRYSPKKDADIYFLFRGTQPEPSKKDSFESLSRDFDPFGVGLSTYQNREEEIKKILNAQINNYKTRINIHINGHSLGGCDAQYAANTILKVMNKSETNIKSLNLFTHNSPGVSYAIAEKFKKKAIKLNSSIDSQIANLNGKQRSELQTLESKKAQVNINLIQYRGDMIQLFGESYVGAGIDINSPAISIKSIKHISKTSLSYFGLHGAKGFNTNNNRNFTTEIYTSKEAVNQIFQKTWYWDKQMPAHEIPYRILEWAVLDISSKIRVPVVSVVRFPFTAFSAVIRKFFIPHRYDIQSIYSTRQFNRLSVPG